MNFTREPIIETIVSPKDGYKLCVKNSKVSGSEEFFVDAVEVVSFGSSLFFRGQERPKPFLVPVSDYEIFEVKETRVVLKNITHDRNIKIGGGRDASLRPAKEHVVEKKEEQEEEKEVVLVGAAEGSSEVKGDRKRDRRRNRRRRLAEEKKDGGDKEKTPGESDSSSEEEFSEEREVKEVRPPSTFSHLLPPPPVLISERLNQLKQKEEAEAMPRVTVEREVLAIEETSSHATFVVNEDEDFPF
ncbi:MAG: hypothetical protein K2Y01_00720 [Rhabdochlamydiaceae bacterium]|nr:hypothetical protein [Rhabdochlamydiaceae bacterium]